MNQSLNRGAALPPPGQLRWHRIVSPTHGRSLRAVILGSSFFGKWTHFKETTLPCTETEDCEYCRGGIAPRYNGYTPALTGNPGQKNVLALTYYGACQLTETLATRGTLRGLEIDLVRKYKSNRAPVLVKIVREISSPSLPEEFDVLDSLARMWGINRAWVERGCRRLGADEGPERFIREEVERAARVGGQLIPTGEEMA